MPTNDNGANGPDSPSDKTQTFNPSHEGKSAQQKSADQLLSEYQIENKRKAQEISDLHAKLDSVQANLEDRIAELQSKSALNSSQQDELRSSREQIEAIKMDKRAAPWIALNTEIAKAEAEKAAKSAMSALGEDEAYAFLEDMCTVDKKNLAEVEKDIVRYMRLVDPGAELSPLRRAREGYKRMKEDQEYQNRIEELKKREQQFSEGTGRRVLTGESSGTLKTEIKRAIETGNITDVLGRIYDQHSKRA